MNRNLGNPDYTVIKPWVQMPSNCVFPTHMAESWLQTNAGVIPYWQMCGGYGSILALGGRTLPDSATGQPFDFANYPELNGGGGLYTQLGGQALPNPPHMTVNLGAEYTHPFVGHRRPTSRGEGLWTAKTQTRVY